MEMTDTLDNTTINPASPPAAVAVVGCGPGSAEYLTDAARRAVAGADALAGSRRLLDLFPQHGGQRLVWAGDADSLLGRIERVRGTGRTVAVLVSGDPGLCSLSRQVIGRFGPGVVRVIPGVSSVQTAFARLGLDWTRARIVSAHGRTPEIAPDQLGGADDFVVLAGTREALQWSAAAARWLEASHTAVLCENLTLAGERVRRTSPEELGHAAAASLSIVLLIRRNLFP